jgi:putative YhdH/YhfP family quinone oxidoreductase
MDRFRAFLLADAGDPRGQFVTRTIDDLDAGDVVVKVAFSDINYKDALAATGRGRILRRPSCIGGIDFSGVVHASADPRFAPGDNVLAVGFDLGVAHDGGYAEYARVPADWLIRLPPTMTLWEAMALGTAGFTAALAITRMEHNGLRPGSGPVIVSGATGGVGSMAIAALARLGHRVVALTGKHDQRPYLEALGASEVMLRSDLDVAQIKPLGKATWAGAVDNLGGTVLAWMASTMKINGVIAAIGLAQDTALHTTVLPFILRGVSLLGINSTDSPNSEQRLETWQRLATDLRPSMLQQITDTIPFDDLPGAFQRFVDGQVSGRVVVQIGNSEA